MTDFEVAEIKLAKKRRADFKERWKNMKTLKQYKDEQMEDEAFAKEYEAMQFEMNTIRFVNGEKNHEDKLDIVDELYGSIPADISLEEAREERLNKI